MGVAPASPSFAQRQRRMWTPRLEIGDVATWWNFSDPAALTYGATGFSQLRSQVGIPYLEQGNSGIQPIRSQINGRPCVDFVGANYLMMMYSAGNVCTMTSAFCIGLVCSIRAAGTNARPVTFIRDPTGGNDYDNSASIALIQRNAANSWQTYQNNGARATSTGITDGEVQVFVIWSDGTNVYHICNGVQTASGTWGTIALGQGRFHIGVYSSGGALTDYRGLYGEMVAMRGGSLARAHRLGGYLAHGWNHQARMRGPYASSPPLIGG